MLRIHLIPLILICFNALASAQVQKAKVLHLPGIGGHMRIDDVMTQGLIDGGLDADVEFYDWTHNDSGLPALGNYNRNQLQAARIAERITELVRADPSRRFILTSHSGGGGLAAWALEKLPEDVKIDTLLMIAPALSPQYDLSKALRHVKGKAYAFTSTLDPINGWGTKGFGTIDRVQTEAAGNVGFKTPPSADLAQYAKLVSFPYNAAWTRFGNAGDHIGAMTGSFSRFMLSPLLKTGTLPNFTPASQPSASSPP